MRSEYPFPEKNRRQELNKPRLVLRLPIPIRRAPIRALRSSNA
jgi:hypothetical protein